RAFALTHPRAACIPNGAVTCTCNIFNDRRSELNYSCDFFGEITMRSAAPKLLSILLATAVFCVHAPALANDDDNRPRARDIGLISGVLPPGKLNAITDVNGVLVGQTTLNQGDDIRTGVTAI